MINAELRKRLIFYVGIGIAWLLLSTLIHFFTHPRTFVSHTLNLLWHLPYLIVVNFILFEQALPFIRRKQKHIVYNIIAGIVIVFLYLCIISFGLLAWTSIGSALHIYTILRQTVLLGGSVFSEWFEEASHLAEGGIASTIFFGFAVLFYNNVRLKLVTQQQQIGIREAELNYLKAQTNPHFLFNTLNNIYVLASEKSDLAPESILRLSKILRFMLYEASAKTITIEQELEIIEDYIELEKLRYDDSLKVNFQHEIENRDMKLQPLLLIPLVENAFKHGVSDEIGDPFIDIQLSVVVNRLNLIVKNSMDNDERKEVKENIGLANLRRQLQLLYTDYSLLIDQSAKVFTVNLNINLASDVNDTLRDHRR